VTDKDGNVLIYKEFIYFCIPLPPEELETSPHVDVFKQLMLEYRRRWGIETGYKNIKSMWGWTTSLSYSLRVWLLMFAFLTYNVWIMENLELIDETLEEKMDEEYICCHTPSLDEVDEYYKGKKRLRQPKKERSTDEFPTRSWEPRPQETQQNFGDALYEVCFYTLLEYIDEFDDLSLKCNEGYDPPTLADIDKMVPVL